MSLEELIERRSHGKIIPKKIPFSQEIKKSIYLLISTLLSLIVILSIVFLLNTNQSSQKGYMLKKEEINKNDYELQKRELTDKITEAQSLKRIEQSSILKQMQKPETQIYIEKPQPTNF